MSALLQRIASVANGLSKAELHVVIELAARAESSMGLELTASSRELAQKTGLARASVQAAIDSLNRKRLIQSDEGSAMRSAVHRLICLAPAEASSGDLTVEPPVAQNLGRAGLKAEPVVAQKLGHSGLPAEPAVAQGLGPTGPMDDPEVAQSLGRGGLTDMPGVARELGRGGVNVGPLLDAQSSTYPICDTERLSACADSTDFDFDFDRTIDRLHESKKVDFDNTLFELARNRIASHHARFARPENRLPNLPDDTITAQFLAVAEWPKLEAMLLDLASERKEAGHSYGWYVTVALQRIHGISPERLREMRVRLKSVTSKSATIPRRDSIQRKPPAIVEVEQLKAQIRALAETRSMR